MDESTETVEAPKLDRVRMPDNNKYSPAEEDEKHRKQSEELILKKELFDKDPSMFIHIDDIILAALKGERGIGIMIGACPRVEMEMSLTRMTYRVYALFNHMDMQAMIADKQRQSGIIPDVQKEGKIIT